MSKESSPIRAWLSMQTKRVWLCRGTRTSVYTCHIIVHMVPVDRLDATPITIDHFRYCYIPWGFMSRVTTGVVWRHQFLFGHGNVSRYSRIHSDLSEVWCEGLCLELEIRVGTSRAGHWELERSHWYDARGGGRVSQASMRLRASIWRGGLMTFPCLYLRCSSVFLVR